MAEAQNFKTARTIGLIGVMIIILVACGYFAGRREAGKESDPLREEIKLITDSLKISKIKYFNLTDSLKRNTGSHEEKIDIINEIKKAIRNEIAKTQTEITPLNTSDLQRYVDSVRSSGGFN